MVHRKYSIIRTGYREVDDRYRGLEARRSRTGNHGKAVCLCGLAVLFAKISDGDFWLGQAKSGDFKVVIVITPQHVFEAKLVQPGVVSTHTPVSQGVRRGGGGQACRCQRGEE